MACYKNISNQCKALQLGMTLKQCSRDLTTATVTSVYNCILAALQHV